MKTVGDVHRRLTSMTEELAALKEAKADTLAVMEMHKQLMEEKGKMAAEYKAKVEAAVEAKVQPEIERRMKEKQVNLDSEIDKYLDMADSHRKAEASCKAKQAAQKRLRGCTRHCGGCRMIVGSCERGFQNHFTSSV